MNEDKIDTLMLQEKIEEFMQLVADTSDCAITLSCSFPQQDVRLTVQRAIIVTETGQRRQELSVDLEDPRMMTFPFDPKRFFSILECVEKAVERLKFDSLHVSRVVRENVVVALRQRGYSHHHWQGSRTFSI